jgi:hypothetical protein
MEIYLIFNLKIHKINRDAHKLIRFAIIIIKTNIIELKITVAIAELSIYILALSLSLSLSLSLMELLSYNS